ncbi:MAG: DEAD/DEAH box helicase [Polyangiales bacterium]
MTESYGTIRRSDWAGAPHWEIECVPHVMMRLKRVFGGIAQDHRNFAYLSDTEENARELEWFLLRFPLTIEDGAATLKKNAKACRAREARVFEMLSPDYVSPLARSMALPPRDYQRLAADMLQKNGSLLLADDLGLGKTVSAICAFAETPGALPALVVTLPHLTDQWADEVARFTPHLRVHVIDSGPLYDVSNPPRKRGASVPPLGVPDVVILNYHKLHRWRDHLAGRFRTIVFDEAHELRHDDSNKYAAARAISFPASYRMGLTGTPIANYGGEIFNVLEVLKPGGLGTHHEFAREFCKNNDRGIVSDPKALGTYLRSMGVFLRRTRADVGRELPPLTIVEHTVDHDPKAIDAVSDRAAELARIILSDEKLKKGEKFDAGGEISYKLRMATGIAKAPYVAAFVKMLIETGEPVVLYGWHREVYTIWLDLLKDLNPVMFTGTESKKQKKASELAFKNGETKLLIMSLRAGAGLDGLQKVCRTTVHGELDWAPMFIEQPIGRVFRDGQEHPVMSYVLLADTGADPVMADVLGLKRFQLTGIRDPTADLSASPPVDPENIRKLAKAFLEQRKKRNAEHHDRHDHSPASKEIYDERDAPAARPHALEASA